MSSGRVPSIGCTNRQAPSTHPQPHPNPLMDYSGLSRNGARVYGRSPGLSLNDMVSGRAANVQSGNSEPVPPLRGPPVHLSILNEPGSRRTPFQIDPQVKRIKLTTNTSIQTEEEPYMSNFIPGLENLLQSGEYSDILLNVKGKEFKAHKNILSAHSPVFTAMMAHDTKEKATGVVNIEDCDPEIFAEFLRFLYSGNNQILNSENVIGLYILADKYQITVFKKVCVKFILNHISLETFCDIMVLALRYQDKVLIEGATDYFVQNSIEIARTDKWLSFMKENITAGNKLFLEALLRGNNVN